jgi:hypothetical protein
MLATFAIGFSEPGNLMTDTSGDTAEFGPWKPGIESQVPESLQHLCTIFRPENASTRIEKARELHDVTGLALATLATFRPARLVLHELLVRVTADISVTEGARTEDLGINFRRIVNQLLAAHIEPRKREIDAAASALRQRIAATVAGALATSGAAQPANPAAKTQPPAGFLARLLGRRSASTAPAPVAPTDQERIHAWLAHARSSEDAVQRATLEALARVASALLVRHERIWGGDALLADVAADLAWNDVGSAELGRLIDPWLDGAVLTEGYRRLPAQAHPIVINIKGPSASGKSTVRPLQRAQAGAIGADPDDFAVISPDIWRKQLVDYATLGDAYRYGGAFTADEIFIIDQKLDRYMADKARRGKMSHLLIDRFRFDSFAHDSEEAGSNLLTRFGHEVYLTFLITPPESLVVRAWNRGLEVGRYKAVDDTLAHAVEAYSGMPQLFFTWAERTDKRVHFEFLDNSVPQGNRPRTVAFGWNGELNVLDVKCLLDVERYRRVDVDATSPAALYPEPKALAPNANTAFLLDCILRLPAVNFADQATGRIYARIEAGKPVFVDTDALAAATADRDTGIGLRKVVPTLFALPANSPAQVRTLAATQGRAHTLGAWGEAAA